MNVHIRHKKADKSGKIKIALEIYKGYTTNTSGTIKADRTTKKLDYFLYDAPKNPSEKLHNKEVIRKVEALKGLTLKELLDGKYGFKSEIKGKANFIDYFRKLTNERFDSKGNYGNWDSVLKHLIKYSGENISFDFVDQKFCEGFKEYLQKTAKTSSGENLSANSVNSYFCKLRAALNNAVEDQIIPFNFSTKVTIPKETEVNKEFLTKEEIQKLFNTSCRYEVLKRAFLFSCLSGLRWSDINLLDWNQLQKEGNNWKIVFHQKKTNGLQYHYINEDAKKLLGDQMPIGKVFVGLRYSAYMNVALLQWVLKAGITKHITFHCGRHTFATMALTSGTDIYTVSKLLGHTEIKTTQVYAKIIDQKKIDAMNNLPNFLT